MTLNDEASTHTHTDRVEYIVSVHVGVFVGECGCLPVYVQCACKMSSFDL